MGHYDRTLGNGYPIEAARCLALGDGSLDEIFGRYKQCMCDAGLKDRCPKDSSNAKTTSSPASKQTTTTRAPTTTRTTTSARPWWRSPTTSHQPETSTAGFIYNHNMEYLPPGLPEAEFSMVQVLGWAGFATLVIVALGAVFKWRYRKRQRDGGLRPRIAERGEATGGFAEPSGAEASSAQFQPTAPMLPTGGLPSELPPPYELVAYPKPPPYESVEKDTKWASAADCSKCDANDCKTPDHASKRKTAENGDNNV